MSAWWDGLTTLQQIFYYIAIPSTVVMLIQTVLMILGLSGHGDIAGHNGPIDGGVGHDIPHDAMVTGHSGFGDGTHAIGGHDTVAGSGYDTHTGHEATDAADLVSFRLFTFQSVMAFLVVFGWTGIAMAANRSIPGLVSFLVALLAGAAALFLTAWLFFIVLKLQNDGNMKLSNAVGIDGEVYIPIPAGGQGQGKVSLLVQGRWVECDAITIGLEPLKTKQAVKVVGVQGGSVLVVEPIQKVS